MSVHVRVAAQRCPGEGPSLRGHGPGFREKVYSPHARKPNGQSAEYCHVLANHLRRTVSGHPAGQKKERTMGGLHLDRRGFRVHDMGVVGPAPRTRLSIRTAER
jgi:hypothetical protein